MKLSSDSRVSDRDCSGGAFDKDEAEELLRGGETKDTRGAEGDGGLTEPESWN